MPEIVIYEPFIYRRKSGYGWIHHCLMEAYPTTKIVTDPTKLFGFEGSVICLRGMTDEMASYRPPFYYPKEIAILSTVKGLVINRTTWEYETLPAPIVNLMPRADIIVVPSRWLVKLFPNANVVVIPDPVKNLQYRKKSGRSFRIGGMIHPSKRRNTEAWLILRDYLPSKFKIAVVIAPEAAKDEDVMKLVNSFADEIHCQITDDALNDFYASLDFFVTFSVGEGFGLPVREALRVGTPVIVPNHTGYADIIGLPGVIEAPTKLVPGDKFGCWHGFVKAPDAKEVAKIIRSVDPPKVPEDLPLPTISDFIKAWHEILPPAEAKTKRFYIRAESNDVVWLVPNATPCGVREVASIWAKRTGGIVVPISQAYCIDRAKAVIIAYHPNFWEWYRWFLPSLARKLRSTIVLWLHRKPAHEDEESMLLSISDVIWTTTEKLQEIVRADGVLPNPIGDKPTRQPIENLFGSFGIYKHETATLINQLGFRLPHLQFKCYWSLSPYFRDPEPVRLLNQAIQDAPANVTHVVGPFDSQELHDKLSELSGYIIWNPPWAAHGESSARIAMVLRMDRPILTNDDSPMVDHYHKYIPTIMRWDVDHLTTMFLRPLDAYAPRNVPTVEEEMGIFRSLMSRISG